MNSKLAIKIMLWALAGIIFFHFTVIFKLVPFEITWGGRLKSDMEMYIFESISILLNLLLCTALLIKATYLKEVISMKFVNIILWFFLFLFVLNTIGNLFAKTHIEKFFAILTFMFSLLIFIILKKKPQDKFYRNSSTKKS
ncbi:hypothetical protein MTsPCn9_09960 [Croceitalea sp. MTPC9]|uniref:Uncharacterized protein n=1 Tax=Croceitalea marina TaxID=1775166 RepID=A0ABW5N0S0_9FLAO|nr:hypothetical protein MTsPCn5_37660 [Croceitalea sp. MTPC5]GMN11397.1 hypothetical protein MTsPCn6_27280 [Croceitalea sp. MTPC6]GMN16060.1 hypothetical protein MTsPCn9_09960 [Croceitalea sp. MTPC9]